MTSLTQTRLSTKLVVATSIPMVALLLVIASLLAVSNTTLHLVHQSKDESAVYAGIARQMQLDVVQVQQWLTDISATRAQDGLDDGFKEAEASAQSFLNGLVRFREMFDREDDTQALAALASIRDAFSSYYDTGKTMANAYIEGGSEQGNKLMASFDEAAETLRERLNPFLESQVSELESSLSTVTHQVEGLRRLVLISGAGTLVCAVFVVLLVIRSISRPIRSAVLNLGETATQVSSAAEQMAASSQIMAEAASEQAAALEQTGASLQEISAATRANSDSSAHASRLATSTREAAEGGAKDMSQLATSMEGIKASSDNISHIIRTIDEIAFQTNLLALNAAVEAARAGDAGLGFAVVADEVRALAQRSAQASRETTTLIESAIDRTHQAVAYSLQVSRALDNIVTGTRDLDRVVSDVSTASGEQLRNLDQLNRAVEEIDKGTQSNAASAEESASASEELNAQASALRDLVDNLRVLVDGTSASQPPSSSPHRLPPSRSESASSPSSPARFQTLRPVASLAHRR